MKNYIVLITESAKNVHLNECEKNKNKKLKSTIDFDR